MVGMMILKWTENNAREIDSAYFELKMFRVVWFNIPRGRRREK
jgi:hypothetical protein